MISDQRRGKVGPKKLPLFKAGLGLKVSINGKRKP